MRIEKGNFRILQKIHLFKDFLHLILILSRLIYLQLFNVSSKQYVWTIEKIESLLILVSFPQSEKIVEKSAIYKIRLKISNCLNSVPGVTPANIFWRIFS